MIAVAYPRYTVIAEVGLVMCCVELHADSIAYRVVNQPFDVYYHPHTDICLACSLEREI